MRVAGPDDEDLETVSVDGDTYHHIIRDTLPGQHYTVTIAPVSRGYGPDITGPDVSTTIST